MNRLNIQKNIVNLMNYNKLWTAVRDVTMELEDSILTPELMNKAIALNFTIVLAAQNKSISFLEYARLTNMLMHECCSVCGEDPLE